MSCRLPFPYLLNASSDDMMPLKACPGSPGKEPEPAGCSGGCGHIGYVLPVPVPRIQVSHKNQLRFLSWLVLRSLTTEEHTPSCIWVLVGGFLVTVCHPSGLNCTQCSQATRPGRAQETVMEGMCKLFMILLTDILLYFLYCAAPFSTV